MTALVKDARTWQIASLGLLLAWGMTWLGFDQKPHAIPLVMAAALATRWALTRAFGLPRFEPQSALITSLSLCLLLRADQVWLLPLAATLAITSKFLIRFDGKHVFNPANFAIVVMLWLGGPAWISPAQWGSATWAAFLFVSLAVLVLSRAKRADIALAFLATYVAILLARAIYLGDPWAIPVKQMQSGAILLFAFFMISDPKTTPDTRLGRIVLAAAVAALAAFIQFVLWRPEGLMYALFLLSPLVPMIDRWRPIAHAERFQWSAPRI